MKYHTKVAGVTFEGRQDIIKDLEPGTPLSFERDPENKYDKNAVKVIAEGKCIGYLPKGSWVPGEIDKGFQFTAQIAQITGGILGMSYGVNVEYEVAKAPLSTAERRETVRALTPDTNPKSAPVKAVNKPETETMKLWKMLK